MRNIQLVGKAKLLITRNDLEGFIAEFNQMQEVSINEISELAHAWGDDHVSSLEAYLFLKKNGATLQNKITVDDIEAYLQFEANYSRNSVGKNIATMFEMVFQGEGTRKISLKKFL